MSTILTSEKKINAFYLLGNLLKNPDASLLQLIGSAQHYNAWFTPQNTQQALAAIGEMLNHNDLETWLTNTRTSGQSSKTVGLVLAGNIPVVGLHDILCVLASDHQAMIKLSSQDQKLIPYILQKLTEIEPAFTDRFRFVERLNNFDAVIATGSNNTSRYFEYYFKNVPHIIRRNRNSIAILQGSETGAELQTLGHDIFDYFGLGCRNVSKIYVPENYDFDHFFKSIEEFKTITDHHKYHHNYDYNKSIFLVNLEKHLDNGFLLLKQDERLVSPLAVLYYEEYSSLDTLQSQLELMADQIQCVVSKATLNLPIPQVSFGQSQNPKLWDYADGINTMEFLNSL
ncbi:MAG TPA: acyl-CoA reductase [Daejeonella sp.]|nr:acyl-CoA reductase [Daejeonella sp.]